MVKQDLFAAEKKDWVTKARRAAETIALENGTVNIDEVLSICPRPGYIHRNTTGKIFSNSVFRFSGVIKSKKVSSKGRLICVWTLDEALYPRPVTPWEREDVY